jgi:hypothetical protein
MIMDNKELKKRSRQAAIISLSGFLIVILVFVAASFKLYDLDAEIEVKKLEIKEKDITIGVKLDTIRLLNDEINLLKDPTIKPLAHVIKLDGISYEQPSTGKKYQLYDFTIWITSSQITLNKIKSVNYYTPVKSILQKNKLSVNRSNSFVVSYRGWGCTDIKITVTYEDGEVEEKEFDMCEFLNGEGKQQRTFSVMRKSG